MNTNKADPKDMTYAELKDAWYEAVGVYKVSPTYRNLELVDSWAEMIESFDSMLSKVKLPRA